jgi:hypothetical protein
VDRVEAAQDAPCPSGRSGATSAWVAMRVVGKSDLLQSGTREGGRASPLGVRSGGVGARSYLDALLPRGVSVRKE